MVSSLYFLVFPWLCFVWRRVPIPQHGVEPVTPTVSGQSPNCWIAREVPESVVFNFQLCEDVLDFFFVTDV